MVRRVLVLAAALTLAGCAGASYVMSEYQGIEPTPFPVEGDDVYRIFDKPADNRLMITPSIAKAMGAGFVQGATFGGVDAMDSIGPKPQFEHAALAYLQSTGRTCRILDGYIVVRPQWEFKYDCRLHQATNGTNSGGQHGRRSQ